MRRTACIAIDQSSLLEGGHKSGEIHVEQPGGEGIGESRELSLNYEVGVVANNFDV